MAVAALDERVVEVRDVSGRAPDIPVHQDGGVQADHVWAAPYERLPPMALDVVLELDTEGPVVPRAAEPPIYLAALEEESPPLAQRHERG